MIRLLISFSLFFATELIALEFSKGSSAAAVYFITPKNDDIVSGEVVVKFGLQNFGVSPAGNAMGLVRSDIKSFLISALEV